MLPFMEGFDFWLETYSGNQKANSAEAIMKAILGQGNCMPDFEYPK